MAKQSTRAKAATIHEEYARAYLVASLKLERKTTKEISEEAEMPISTVNWYVNKAFKLNLFKLNAPEYTSLSADLKRELQLVDAVVVNTSEIDSIERRREAIGRAAADYFIRTVPKIATVGFSGGRYMLEMVKELDLPECKCSNLIVTGLAETGIHEAIALKANFIVELIKIRNPNIEAYGFSFPPVDGEAFPPTLDDENVVRDFLQKRGYKKIEAAYDRALKSTHIFISLGILDERSTFFLELDEKQQARIKQLKDAGEVVGDCLYHLINPKGELVTEPPLVGRFFSIPLMRLRDMVEKGTPVTVLAGEEKAPVVKAAYRGGLFNRLICDVGLARILLRESK
jgi:DNA-binding transcriptional regulator LsrR (DeoR family)